MSCAWSVCGGRRRNGSEGCRVEQAEIDALIEEARERVAREADKDDTGRHRYQRLDSLPHPVQRRHPFFDRRRGSAATIVQMVSAPELEAEYAGCCRALPSSASFRPPPVKCLLELVALKADILSLLGPIPAFTRDPKDDKFIACALVGQAQYLITVDTDLLVLGTVDTVRIVTPEAFLAALSEAATIA